jgi:myo-inositol-1(or 4)-monophosphatase
MTKSASKRKEKLANPKPTPKQKATPKVVPFMKETAEAAGEVLRKYFLKVKQIERKPNAGIVTEADKKAEGVILRRVLKNFPKSSIITEESGEYAGGDLTWFIDPLDGTSNYAHGFPWFCVSIGVYLKDEPYAGVVYHPLTGEMFYAEKGKGAFLNGKRIFVSKTGTVEDALLGTGFFYSTGDRLRAEVEIFRRVQEKALGIRRPGSAALDLACVAAGRFDGFWERGLAPWDMAAGFVLVKEAGGRLTRYNGEGVRLQDAEVVATNSNIHGQVLELIQT